MLKSMKRNLLCIVTVSAMLMIAASFITAFTTAEEPKAAVTPAEALKRLQAGNERFVTGKPEHPRGGQARIKETAEGQEPFATILTCSDSRMPAELIFDQGIGDLFVVRVAGNVCESTQLGTIKYSVDPLGSKLCVVMGHTKCGAVAAACTVPHLDGHVGTLLQSIRPAVERVENSTGKSGEDIVEQTAKENVFLQIESLYHGSKPLREAARNGKLMVVGAIYDIGTGKVSFLGLHPKNDELIKEPKAWSEK